MEFKKISSIKGLDEKINKNDALLIYFSHDKCNVCKVLKPKVAELINSEFPKMELSYVDTVNSPKTAGQYGIFTVPTIMAFFNGKESFRKSRNIGLRELETEISRPYSMTFSK